MLFGVDEPPPDYRPIVQVIDNYERNSRPGAIFETRVGPGKLLVCGLDLDIDLVKRPAARQLRQRVTFPHPVEARFLKLVALLWLRRPALHIDR